MTSAPPPPPASAPESSLLTRSMAEAAAAAGAGGGGGGGDARPQLLRLAFLEDARALQERARRADEESGAAWM